MIYSPLAEDHLRLLTARQQAMVLDGVDQQLAHQPTVRTRNRKPLRANQVAPWELRIGMVRVDYDAKEDPEPVVSIQAVGIKRRNRVYIGGEVVEL